MRYQPDLGGASDWLNKISHVARPIRITTLIWVVTRHQYGISVLVSQASFGGKPVIASPNVGCFLRLIFHQLCIQQSRCMKAVKFATQTGEDRHRPVHCRFCCTLHISCTSMNALQFLAQKQLFTFKLVFCLFSQRSGHLPTRNCFCYCFIALYFNVCSPLVHVSPKHQPVCRNAQQESPLSSPPESPSHHATSPPGSPWRSRFANFKNAIVGSPRFHRKKIANSRF